ncbi:hypothetical protein Tsubulata_044294 [Turnera subulata]|uniref:Sodium transporter HKT1 n=1 Tax=Turnera subulata TaxID=218843 RepID=A0A9Q0GLM8_9ROSI|nr:hypothetical protein Tsubulata_044294 [Turnera subulata]
MATNGFHKSWNNVTQSLLGFILFKAKPFWIHLTYFVTLSLFGFWALKISKPKTSFRPGNLDLFFTSVSSVTVSSMSTVEMEALSETQLIVLTILMLLGGEVFTSMLSLQLARLKFPKQHQADDHHQPINLSSTYPTISSPPSSNNVQHRGMMMGRVTTYSGLEIEKITNIGDLEHNKINMVDFNATKDDDSLKYDSIRCLGYLVLLYLVVVHISGSSLVAAYISLIPSATQVLASKGLRVSTFSVFTTVSTFANCGFLPTNENMMVFKKNSGLQLILIAQVLMGNTLYAPCLRFLIWVGEKLTRREELRYLLLNAREIGYCHLFSGLHSLLLAGTVVGFILVQFVVFCAMEWNSQVMDGLSSYEKIVAALFEVVNSRHAGESVFDISTISQAILVLFVVMMYLPPYFSFLPPNLLEDEPESGEKCKKEKKSFMKSLVFSQLSYLAIFIILVCIAERDKMKKDPLNFNVLNVTIEVISAYGNVGFSTGYSCERQLKPESSCKDACYGFSGKWSSTAKFILIIVMFFGRLKCFFNKTGKAWRIPN